MTNAPDHADITNQIDELGQRIHAARAGCETRGLSPEAETDWQAMVARHEQIRSRLTSSHDAGNDIVESARMDIETLSNSIGRWIERIERHTPGSIGASPGKDA
jgi:hypothetical protein